MANDVVGAVPTKVEKDSKRDAPRRRSKKSRTKKNAVKRSLKTSHCELASGRKNPGNPDFPPHLVLIGKCRKFDPNR